MRNPSETRPKKWGLTKGVEPHEKTSTVDAFFSLAPSGMPFFDKGLTI